MSNRTSEELRVQAKVAGSWAANLLNEAADAIDVEHAQNAKLRETLKQIAAMHGEGPRRTHEGDLARLALAAVAEPAQIEEPPWPMAKEPT